MGIPNVIVFFGALATFLFGMSTLTSGLEKLSSGRLESIMEKLTNNIFKSVLVGAVVTGLVHSSAATTIMCVGFVNSGVMKLEQTVGIIMGANIGTTVTAQILRLGDLSTDNLFLMLMTPEYFGPLMAIVGILFYSFFSGGVKKTVGKVFLGLGLLFTGMKTMENAMAPLAEIPEFQNLFAAFSNPFLGILVGALVTALVQSSTASVGILQALTSTGVITFNVAMPIIFGQNIGTCVTSILSSLGASKNAKRTAALHLMFNIVGTMLFIVVLYSGQLMFQFPFWESLMTRGSIANMHTVFNVVSTLILLPFNKLLVKAAERIIPGDDEEREFTVLDERFLATPALALERAHDAVVQMGEYAIKNYNRAVELLSAYDGKKLDRLHETENAIDKIEDMLNDYLVRLTDRSLTSGESMSVSELLHTLGDFERIGDYAVNLSECATALRDRNLVFSPQAKGELNAMTSAVQEILDTTLDCYRNRSRTRAFAVEPQEEVIDLMEEVLKSRHVERLKTGECTVELGTQFLELLINLERISDHCSNVGIYILRETSPAGEATAIDAHEYLKSVHAGGNGSFDTLYSHYKEKYYERIRETAQPEAR
ncbi:MAG: Na/Pi cotransporter family protein [Oscillospiraceae bacterium]|nr:Na/Pi cotransporter family protein [Oscillospiraceae bacterium]